MTITCGWFQIAQAIEITPDNALIDIMNLKMPKKGKQIVTDF